MELRDALRKAAAFAAKKGAPDDPKLGVAIFPPVFDLMQEVPLVDDIPYPAQPGFVVATSGDAGVLIHLDPGVQVPHVVVNAAQLRKALLVVKKEPFRLAVTSPTVVTLVTERGLGFNLSAQPAALFPPVPPQPSTYRPFSMSVAMLLRRVLHATAKEKAAVDYPEMAAVHLTRGYAEATDQHRLARAPLPPILDTGCLVSPSILRAWPAKLPVGGLGVGTAGDHIWVQVGEELRFAKMAPDSTFAQLDTWLEKDHGFHVDFDTPALIQAVDGARKSSPDDLVQLAFSSGSVEVAGRSVAGAVTSRTILPAAGATEPVPVLLRGSYLHDAMTQFPAKVRCYYTSSRHPVRLEDPYLTALVWPTVLDMEVADEAGN